MTPRGKKQCSYFPLLQSSRQSKHLPPLRRALGEGSGSGGSGAPAKPCSDGLDKHGVWEGEEIARGVLPRLLGGFQMFVPSGRHLRKPVGTDREKAL